MKYLSVQYSFTTKDFRRRLLRHIRIIYFITIPQVIIFIIAWIIMLANAYKNNNIALIASIITCIFLISCNLSLAIYIFMYKNRLINAKNMNYMHFVEISNNQLSLTLKSSDFKNIEKYFFEIKKIKREGDTYILYKNRNHFIYLPTKYVDASFWSKMNI